MIIRSSHEVVSATLLERFPVPKNFGVPEGSRVERGRSWPAPTGAKRLKTFEIYRYDPDSAAKPRLLQRAPLTSWKKRQPWCARIDT